MAAVDILLPAFVFSILLVATHVYFGLHVLARGIIFVDLAMAQVAALGISIGFVLGHDPHGGESYAFAFIGALAAAFGFSLLRNVPGKTMREVIIGCVYVVAIALSILSLGQSGQGMEELKALLNGSILFVTWRDIAVVAALCLALMALHVAGRRQFLALSGLIAAERPRFFWELAFFVSFAATITASVHSAGVLMVFAYLIVPAFSASLLWAGFARRLVAGWVLGVAGTLAGLAAAYALDLPVGAAVVTALGLVVAASGAARRFLRRR